MPESIVADARNATEWRPAPTPEGRFEVSKDGRVRNRFTEKELTLTVGKTGYQQFVTRSGRKSRARLYKAHRLVALAWVGPQPTPAHVVNHKDGNKLNNHASNLEWVTPAENVRHAYRLGLREPLRGEERSNAKLTEADVRFIRRVYTPRCGRYGCRALARRFGVHHQRISEVVARKAWAHVGEASND